MKKIIIFSLFFSNFILCEQITLQNDWIKVLISADKGAIVRSFKYKEWGENEIIDSRFGGLLMDHFWQQTWPGEFLDVPYEFKIITNTPFEGDVVFSKLSTGEWRGNTLPNTKDIFLEKRVILPENKPYLKTIVSLTNKSNVGKIVGLWEQNIFYLGENPKDNIYLRPSLRGIRIGPGIEDFVKDIAYGWTGVIEPKSKRGMIFLIDYNYLMWLYNCFSANTTEWQYDKIALPVGKVWSTEFYIIPTYGFENFSHATENFITDLSIKKENGFLYITQYFRSSVKDVKNVVVETEFEELRTGRKYKLNEIKFESLGIDIKSKTLKCNIPCDPLIFRIKVNGEYLSSGRFEDYYEYYYGGNYGENLRIDLGNPLYVLPKIEKKKVYLKPDKIEKVNNEFPHVLLLKGLFTDKYRIEEGFFLLSPKTYIKNSYLLLTQFGTQIDYFPPDYGELMSYDFIIFSDIDVYSLGDMATEMIKDYVENGGNLVIFGGPFAYGNGRYKGTRLEEILPIVIGKRFDIKKAKDTRIKTNSKFKIGDIHCFYIHDVKPKKGSKILFTCDGNPFIIMGKFGNGNVICFTGTPMGESKKEGFWEWNNWVKLLFEIFKEAQK